MMLAAMRHFAADLRQRGYRVYTHFNDPDNRHTLIAEAERLAHLHGCDEIHVTRPGEWHLLNWRFLERHTEKLADNPRMRVIYGTLDKMSVHKRKALRERAETFFDSLKWAPPYGKGQHESDYGE